jgi:hypothetical protein
LGAVETARAGWLVSFSFGERKITLPIITAMAVKM